MDAGSPTPRVSQTFVWGSHQDPIEEADAVLLELQVGLRSIAATLPPHLSPLSKIAHQSTVGITIDHNNCHVAGMIPGGPAACSKAIAVGDIIVSIDGMRVDHNTSTDSMIALLHGDDSVGGTLHLKVRHGDNAERPVELHRVPVSAIVHNKRLFELFSSLQDKVRHVSSSGEGKSSPGLFGIELNGSPAKNAHSNLGGDLSKIVSEAMELWAKMVEEEDQRTESVEQTWDAGVDRLDKVMTKIKEFMRQSAKDLTEERAKLMEETKDKERERADWEVSMDSMQLELGDMSDEVRIHKEKIQELEEAAAQEEGDGEIIPMIKATKQNAQRSAPKPHPGGSPYGDTPVSPQVEAARATDAVELNFLREEIQSKSAGLEKKEADLARKNSEIDANLEEKEAELARKNAQVAAQLKENEAELARKMSEMTQQIETKENELARKTSESATQLQEKASKNAQLAAQLDEKEAELARKMLEMTRQLETNDNELALTKTCESAAHFQEKASEVAAELARINTELATKTAEIERLKTLLKTKAEALPQHPGKFAGPPQKMSSTPPQKNQNEPAGTSGGWKNVCALAQEERYKPLMRLNVFILFVMLVIFLTGANCRPCAGGRRFVAHIQ